MSKKKVLYISYDGLTDPLGQSQVIPYLIGLSDEYEIHIISCEKKENYTSRRHAILDTLNNSDIVWHPISYTKKPPVLSTVFDIIKIRTSAFDLHRKLGFSMVHCRSYISSLIGLEMKHKFGCKFIFDMRGFWADERVDGGLWNLQNPLYNLIYSFFKKKERQFLQQADYTISLTENAKDEIYSWPEIQKNRVPIKVIPCCVDLELFSLKSIKEDERRGIRENLGLNAEDFIMIYLGGIGTWYMLDEMLDFFIRLKIVKKFAKFLFVTAEDESLVRSMVEKKGVDQKDIFVKRAERKEVPLYISLADLSIFFIKPSYSKKASSPTKQGELMSMGIPVICNSNVGDTDYVINKYKSGLLVKKFNHYEFDQIVSEIHNASFNKEVLRSGAHEFFSLERGVESYKEIYKTILSE